MVGIKGVGAWGQMVGIVGINGWWGSRGRGWWGSRVVG